MSLNGDEKHQGRRVVSHPYYIIFAGYGEPFCKFLFLGEMLSRFSNGKFRAPVHRVDAKHKNKRISLVSFWAPNYETLLPDPQAKSKRIFAGEYYMSRNNMI